MTGHIAVGLDGSRESLAAADWAAGEARLRGLPLRLVHAWEGPKDLDLDLDGDTGQKEPDLPELAVPRHWARRILRSAENGLSLRHPDLRIVADLVPEPPAEAMAEAAGRAELLVLGSRGLGGVAGFLVGSVAMSTVAHAGRPVVLVRAGQGAPGNGGNNPAGEPYHEVVVGIDARRPCDPVAGFAFDAAARRGAPLCVVNVWNPPSSYADLPVSPQEPDIDAAFGERARRAVTAALRPWREKYPELEVTEVSRTGKAARNLIECASSAKMLVIGRRIRRSAVGAHIGPVAHAVIHHARCPVAVVPHE
ncbi:universal stress protein [Streptomyces sp. MST-110588]|uniref:universal stress protein n=1 Tax=Streptomyces sp. MST-110588 TaxID=2833628 RepID=UPI001F5C2B46|nr:universal stress protein [Streptomyces sp. MST-110588]UNO43389.1 universal stress protein [Streptomyces sp. MST-110588]